MGQETTVGVDNLSSIGVQKFGLSHWACFEAQTCTWDVSPASYRVLKTRVSRTLRRSKWKNIMHYVHMIAQSMYLMGTKIALDMCRCKLRQ